MPSHASRFAAHLAALGSGALAVIFALTLSPGGTAWAVLGLGAVASLTSLAAFAVPDQGRGARITEVLLILIGAWTIVAARVFFDPGVVRWLCFANGAALCGLGALGLIIHERKVEERLRRMDEEERQRLAFRRRRATAAEAPLHGAGR